MSDGHVQDLLQQIADDHPCGRDMSFSALFDEIREARRADDPNLAQGEWQSEIKSANWPKVRDLCENALRTKTKDMQIAAWYAEALTRLDGFDGLERGLTVLNALVHDYWEFCYPAFDPDDLDERAGKIEWLNATLSLAVRSIPVTRAEKGGYPWLAWSESRAVENLGLKDAAAKERALAEGRLAADVFDKAVAASGAAFYDTLERQANGARAAFAEFEANVDKAFGRDAPGLKDLRQAIADSAGLVERLARQFGSAQPMPAAVRNKSNKVTIMEEKQLSVSAPASAVHPGALRTRADAVRALRDVAQFFRQNEPHSPVGPLAERAAKWAEMPLDQWLASVIKDDGTLAQLKELLDLGESS